MKMVNATTYILPCGKYASCCTYIDTHNAKFFMINIQEAEDIYPDLYKMDAIKSLAIQKFKEFYEQK